MISAIIFLILVAAISITSLLSHNHLANAIELKDVQIKCLQSAIDSNRARIVGLEGIIEKEVLSSTPTPRETIQGIMGLGDK
ncbi:MAG: hypothetical protein AAGA46_03370 [Cyanobacteria bacterium P01_F01_bin.13]